MKMPKRNNAVVSKQANAMAKQIKGLASSNKQIMLFDWQIEILERIGTRKAGGTQSAIIKEAFTDWCKKHGHAVPE